MRHGNAKRDMSRLAESRRKRRQRNALRSQGLVVMQVWIPRRCRKKVRRFIARLGGRAS